MALWQEFIVLFGGNALLLAACAWLIESLLTHRLAKDIKVFETELKAKADASTEQLKSLLQIAALEHQVRFSSLHEKRAEVIAELYKLIVQAFLAGQSFVSPMQFPGEPSKQEKAKETWDKMRECYLFFETNRIYLSRPLCTSLAKFIDDMRSAVIQFDMSLDPEDSMARKNKMTAWIKANQAFDKEISEARRSLETEFRKILGVNVDTVQLPSFDTLDTKLLRARDSGTLGDVNQLICGDSCESIRHHRLWGNQPFCGHGRPL